MFGARGNVGSHEGPHERPHESPRGRFARHTHPTSGLTRPACRRGSPTQHQTAQKCWSGGYLHISTDTKAPELTIRCATPAPCHSELPLRSHMPRITDHGSRTANSDSDTVATRHARSREARYVQYYQFRVPVAVDQLGTLWHGKVHWVVEWPTSLGSES